VSVLLRAAELVKRPVVTLAGDDVAQIKDVIYSSHTGELAGFTLNGRGLFAGPMRKTLPWENVHGLGPAAVMIRDETSLADRKALQGETEGAGGAVLGSAVITHSGRNLGVVTDVILAVGETTDAVGYEIDPSDASAPRRQFVPLPDALAVSGEALMLPDAATEFIRDDLAGFGAAVEEFRSRLRSQPADKAEPTDTAQAGASHAATAEPTDTAQAGASHADTAEPTETAEAGAPAAGSGSPATPDATAGAEPTSPVRPTAEFTKPTLEEPITPTSDDPSATKKLPLDGPTAGGNR
jgi:uncharacterized protein YrrD